MPTIIAQISGEELLAGAIPDPTQPYLEIPSLSALLFPDEMGDALPFAAYLPTARFLDSTDFSAQRPISITTSATGYTMSFGQTSPDGVGLTYKAAATGAQTATTSSAIGSASWAFKPSPTSPIDSRADTLAVGVAFAQKAQMTAAGTAKMVVFGSSETTLTYSGLDSLGTLTPTDTITVSGLASFKTSGTVKATGDVDAVMVSSGKFALKDLSFDQSALDKTEQGLALAVDLSASATLKGKIANYSAATSYDVLDALDMAANDADFSASVDKEELKYTKFDLKDTRALNDRFALSFTGTQTEDYLTNIGTVALVGTTIETLSQRIETASFKSSYEIDPAALEDVSASVLDPLMVGVKDNTALIEALDYARSDFRALLLGANNKITLLKADAIDAGAGNDTITGSLGDDTIGAGAGNDNIIAGAGNDRILTGGGSDTVDGGLNTSAGDTVILEGIGETYLVSGTAASFVVLDVESRSAITVKGVEHVEMNGQRYTAAEFVSGTDTITAANVINLDGAREGSRSVTGVFALLDAVQDATPEPSSDTPTEDGAIWAPFARNLLDDAQTAEAEGVVGRMNAQTWLGAGLAYNDDAATHVQSFTSQDGATLKWNDATTLTSTAIGGSLKRSGDFAYTGPTKGASLAQKTDKLIGKVSLEEAWTNRDAKGMRSETVKNALSYSGVDSKGTAALGDDATVSFAMTSDFTAKITGSGEAAASTAIANRKMDASYKSGGLTDLVSAAISFSDKREMAYAGEQFPSDNMSFTKDLTTVTLSKFSFEDKAAGLFISLTGTETQDRLQQDGVSKLTGIIYNTADYKSTTALVSYRYAYDETSENRGLFDWLIGPQTLDPGNGLSTQHLNLLFAQTVAPGEYPVYDSFFTEAFWQANNNITLLKAAEIEAGAGNDTITGSAGNDTIGGGDGVNLLNGGAGADLLIIGAGSDTIDGGAGTDTVDLTTFGTGHWGGDYTVTGTAAKFVIKDWSNATVTTVSNVEKVIIATGYNAATNALITEEISTAVFLAQFATPTAQLGLDDTQSALDMIGADDAAQGDLGVVGLLKSFSAGLENDDSAGGTGAGAAEGVVAFDGFLPFAREIGAVVDRMQERTWDATTQVYDPNLDSHKLAFTDTAGGAKLLWNDTRAMSVTTAGSTETYGADFTYTGPTKIAGEKADALKGGYTEALTSTARNAAGVATYGEKRAAFYSGVEGGATAALTDDVKFAFNHSSTLTGATTRVGLSAQNGTETYIESNIGSYAGKGIKLDFALSAKADYLFNDLLDETEAVRERIHTKATSTDTLSKFAFEDAGAALKLGFTATETMNHLTGQGSLALKAISIETAAFKSTNAALTMALTGENESLLSILGDLLDQDVGDMSGATATLTSVLDELMAGHDIVTLKAQAAPLLVQTLAGNDKIIGSIGADTVDAGEGNDTIDGGAGNDTIFGGAGNDSVLGGLGDDVIKVSLGADTIDGGAQNAAGGDLLDLSARGYALGNYKTGYTVSGTAANFTLTDFASGTKTVVKGVEKVLIGGQTLASQAFLTTPLKQDTLSVAELITSGNEAIRVVPVGRFLDLLADRGEDDDIWSPLANQVDRTIITDLTWQSRGNYTPSGPALSVTSAEGAHLDVDFAFGGNATSFEDVMGDYSVGGTAAMALTFTGAQGSVDSLNLTLTMSDTLQGATVSESDYLSLSYNSGDVHYSFITDSTMNFEDRLLMGDGTIRYSAQRSIDNFTISYSDSNYDFTASVVVSYDELQQYNTGNEHITFNQFSFSDAEQGFSASFSGYQDHGWSEQSDWNNYGIYNFTLTSGGVKTVTEQWEYLNESEAPDAPLNRLDDIFKDAAGGLAGAADLIRSTLGVFTADGDNLITGSDADNFIFASAGVDTVKGGLGSDTFVFDSAYEDGMAPTDFNDLLSEIGYIAKSGSTYTFEFQAWSSTLGGEDFARTSLTSVEKLELNGAQITVTEFYADWREYWGL